MSNSLGSDGYHDAKRLLKSFALIFLLATLNVYILTEINRNAMESNVNNREEPKEDHNFQDAYSVTLENNHIIFHKENIIANNNIFFWETSSRSTLNLKELCSLESAALLNPNQSVYFIMTNASIVRNKAMKTLEKTYKNIKIISIDLTYIFKGTPLEKLWLDNRLQRSTFYNAHVADVLRVWTLYNYGGTYLDSDTIVLKTLNYNFNFAGAENLNPFLIDNAVLHFERGHPLMKMYIEDVASNFDGNGWGTNGPIMLTKNIKLFCAAEILEEINSSPCAVQVMNTKEFYPLYYHKWKHYFDPDKRDTVINAIKNSTILHYWGKLSSKTNIKPGMPIHDIALKKCPQIANYFT